MAKILSKVVSLLYNGRIKSIIPHIRRHIFKFTLGHYTKTSMLAVPKLCSCPRKIYMYDSTNINEGAVFIINPLGNQGRFVMKKNSGAAANLTVITGNHQRASRHLFKEQSANHSVDIDKDVIVEEDVWIGANVTLLSGVTIGRGATVGAGSVCIKSIPPYAVVMGNPAKVIGFNFTPDEIIEHEQALYQESERLPLGVLQKNYEKYFLSKINDIKQFTKL